MVKRIWSFATVAACLASGLLLDCAPAAARAPRLGAAPAGSFSIVMLSDTQGYLGRGTKLQPDSDIPTENPVFDAETQWVVDNIKTQKIAFVTHGGDIVDRNNNAQWQLARHYLDRLHGIVPYGLVVGNHDMTAAGDSSLFQTYFPAARFRNFSWYGGTFTGEDGHPEISGNNANSYETFAAGGVRFVILHVECNAPDDVLHWVDSVLDRYPDRFGIVVTHMFLGPVQDPGNDEDENTLPKGVMEWKKRHGALGNTPQQMWDKSFRHHENLRLILSGDQSTPNAAYLRMTGDRGNVVHALLSDYSTNDHGHIVNSPHDDHAGKHGGGIRIYRFLPSKDEIDVITFDAMTKEIIEKTDAVPDGNAHNFVIHVNLPRNGG